MKRKIKEIECLFKDSNCFLFIHNSKSISRKQQKPGREETKAKDKKAIKKSDSQSFMGCSVSRPDGHISDATVEQPLPPPSPLPLPRTRSIPTPLVHHPPLKKGDSHHLVSLTSTTYGSLLLDTTTTTTTNPNFNGQDHPRPSSSPDKTLTVTDRKPSSPDSVINTWELMAGLDDHDSFVFESPKKIYNSFESMESFSDGKVKKSPSKPLWKHLSEESLLADMDPNVVSSFRRALSSRQLGYNHNHNHNQSKTIKSVGGSCRVSPLFDNRIRLPGTEDRIVLYFTSLRGIRRTYEDCCAVRTIFRGFRVLVDERDISMDSAYRKELQSVVGEKTVILPQVFIGGKNVGGADEIKQLHEVGELGKLLEGFPVRDPRFVCENCGDARFVPCLNCNGSRKIFEEEEGQLQRCPDCNENGLIRCPNCCS
ncbi:hypothetical protein HHK36_019613 [Tetracentron sinense]|uniref:Glutaredoxin domain-containing protein n=1 Tax=Tetracentron sinense TaxID=13715 RepID=A0A834Z078_TETSI|nr:hypothetical protein HHK36_019613 [Tetracentron sinense]